MSKTELKIQSYIAEKRYEDLLSLVEDHELEVSNDVSTALPHYTVGILANLILGDVDNARFMWKRVPIATKKTDPEIEAAWLIGHSIWKNDFTAVYQAFKAFQWKGVNATLVEILEETYRNRVIANLSRAYSTISVSSLSVYLGLNEEATAAFIAQNGWELKDGLVKPKPVPHASTALKTTENMQALTDYVVFLESEP
eukprot:TRINITY_DN4137_c0_g1_i1.p1 TRINITY_DN4137_c0_g1~~TRINITY_DN4137_c0_g1_i1.p1  ORF type:complete len:198 (-),score=37.78 TRINITY_DN4137_c0_g1_i1:36-629(-)